MAASNDPYIRGIEVGRAEVREEADNARADLRFFLDNLRRWWATYRTGEAEPQWAAQREDGRL